MPDLTNVETTQPVEPIIECDGWYAICRRCKEEVEPKHNTCPNCQQAQDWSWFKKGKNVLK